MNELQEKEIALKYFLGELSGAELESVEERSFIDEEYSDFLDEIETDLVDEYVRNELSSDHKQKFEKNYLVSENRQNRVKAATAIWERLQLDSTAEVKTVAAVSNKTFWEKLNGIFRIPTLVYGLSALLIIILVGGIWLGLRKKDDDIARITPTPTPIVTPNISPTPSVTPISPTPLPTSPKAEENKEPKKQTETNKPNQENEKPERKIETPQPMIATFILSGGGLRGNDETQKLVLPSQTKSVVLKVEDKQIINYNRFQIRLEDENGTTIFSRELKLNRSVKNLNIGLPAKNLLKGNYKLTVNGAKAEGSFEPVNFYKFSVVRK